MPDWLVVIILGIVEGVTELLPVSSTGHLLIAERWLPRQSDLFNIVIQCGAMLAILPLPIFRARLKNLTRDYALKLALAFGITGAGGLALDRAGLRLPDTVLPVAIALLVGGVLFLVVERWLVGRAAKDEITWAVAAAVGAAQLVAAVFPGTSRSGATILVMLAFAVSRIAATEFAFLVGIPTILAGGALKMFKAFTADGGVHEDWGLLALAFVVSGVVSFVAVKWLLGYVQRNTFNIFGWYRIAVGAALLLLVYLDV